MCPQPLQAAAVMILTWGEQSHPKPEPFWQFMLFPGNWQQEKQPGVKKHCQTLLQDVKLLD